MHRAGQRARHLLSTTVVGLVYSGVGFSYWHWSVPSSLVSKKIDGIKKCSSPAMLTNPASWFSLP